MEKLTGIIQRVIFKSDDTGYAVVSIKLDYTDPDIKKYQDYLISNLLTVTCYYDRAPIKDEEYSYLGEFVQTKYGIQLKASSYERPNSDTLEAVVTYLSSEYFKGIGKITAAKIYERLGSKCLDEIRNDKSVLDLVEGLTTEQKDIIYSVLVENEQKEKSIVQLVQLGFTIAMAKKIQSVLKPKEIKIVLKNPYYLIDKVEGIGFLKADNIALKQGIAKNDPIRLKACIVFFLYSYTYETGNCYIEKDYLKEKVLETLNKEEEIIDGNTFENILEELVNDGKVVLDEKGLVYDLTIHHAEDQLAVNIVARIKNEELNSFTDLEIKNALEKAKKDNKIEYSPMQEKAIITALKENIMIITGGPGTGKTTIVKGIIDTYARLFNSDNVLEEVVLLAPTGRASKRLNEVTKHKAQTIHKFLGFDGKKFLYGERNQVFAKMVIIDEMSMVDILIASRLFSAIPSDCKIVVVGDVDQIPSVSPGEVLSDLIKTKEITTIRLNEIHRQAKDSSIISLAHTVNQGLVPENILEKQHDRNFIYLEDSKILENIKVIINQALSKNMDILKDIQVLIPMYRGELGIDNVNNYLQEFFNPLKDGEDELITMKQKFRINDKVIQLVNRNEDQIMNGDIGYVFAFIYTNGQITGMTVQFESSRVDYIKEEYDQLKLAYAISIHKSQGSEFKTVIIPFTSKYYAMLKRRLYYTAITRAKSYLIMIGNYESLKLAASSVGFPRKTKLVELVKEKIGKKELSPYDFL
ncbi:MAG: ATP-dependent RecD-like DNA helicase [Bacilli bacterium]|nr:ATP-dependent RecD-like DNA helicase [Bacilli bacterium]